MSSRKSQPNAGHHLPMFTVACWFLGMTTFVQLLVSGMALATKFEDSRVVHVVEKPVPKPVVVQVPAPAPQVPNLPQVSSATRAPTTALTAESNVQPSPLKIPSIADPRSERMVIEARQARVAGDMGRAIIKLEEALKASPNDPSVHYEMGFVHEQMGVFDIAAAHYEKVFQMGASQAGALYELAATKLRDGFETPDTMLGKLSLGRIRIFSNPNDKEGQQVVLTIPVLKAPANEIDISQIAVSVVFFNRNNKGEIIQLDDKSWVKEQWVSLPFDWVGDEENLRMTYTIPKQDKQTEHLFGKRAYYGQVVSLTYKGEVLDVQAWPRDLAARIPKAPTMGRPDWLQPEFQDSLPPDFDPDMPLLPTR